MMIMIMIRMIANTVLITHTHRYTHEHTFLTHTRTKDKHTGRQTDPHLKHANLPACTPPMHAHPILECHSLFTMQFWWMPTAATPSTRTTDDLHATLASVAHCTVNSFHDCGILRS